MAQSSSAQRDPSMEEILASIRKIIEEGEETAPRIQQRESFEPSAIGPAANDAMRSAPAQPHLDSPRLAPEPAVEMRKSSFDAPLLDAETLASLEAATASLAAGRVDDFSIDDFDLDINETEVKSLLAVPATRSTIISESTGRQVTASFSELTEALSASRQRPLDQVAEDMLRPMLQDWLDNNLPTMVERLVREEIERVARGG